MLGTRGVDVLGKRGVEKCWGREGCRAVLGNSCVEQCGGRAV